MRRAVGWGMLAGALAVAAAAPARAADDRATREAQARFEEGLLRVKGGDFEAARISFAQAYVVLRKPDILWNLALSEEKSGHLVDALGHFKELGRQATTDADRANAKKHADDLTAQTGHIEVLAPVGTQVSVDSAPAGTTPLVEPVDVAPGKHHVEAHTQQGWAKSADADAAAGQIAHVAFSVGESPALVSAPTAVPVPGATSAQPASPEPQAPPPPPDTATPVATGGTFWDARGITVVVVGSAAVVAGAFGLGFGLASSSDADTASRLRAQNTSCNGAGAGTPGCQQLASTTDAQHSEHVASTALWITGGVLAVGAVATWFLWPKLAGSRSSNVSVTVIPGVGAGSAGAMALGSF